MNTTKQVAEPTAAEGHMDSIDQIPAPAAMPRPEPETANNTDNDTNTAAIAVEDVHKSFGAQKVLNGVSLAVSRGQTLAVLGRSGTGKSVLLRLIIGLEKPDAGSIRI